MLRVLYRVVNILFSLCVLAWAGLFTLQSQDFFKGNEAVYFLAGLAATAALFSTGALNIYLFKRIERA